MSKKRPLAPPASPTDEWGIYDPAKAGMQALYSRLGRPVVRTGDDGERRRRRRGFRPDREADGVATAIQEALRRADRMASAQVSAVPPPEIVAAVEPPEMPVPPPVVPVDAAPAVTPPPAAKKGRARAAKPSRRKTGTPVESAATRVDAAATRVDAEATRADTAAVTADAPAPKRGRKTARGRVAAKETVAATETDAAIDKPSASVPPPSPRRPRGPVPLAAWAHAVSDAPRPESARAEGKGLWRGIFRIPSEVALVEYGRGCRIHRLVIEGGSDAVVDPF
ncbi:MAG: hypothetical protein AB7U83_03060 [Vicinamibacterales bacterium]